MLPCIWQVETGKSEVNELKSWRALSRARREVPICPDSHEVAKVARIGATTQVDFGLDFPLGRQPREAGAPVLLGLGSAGGGPRQNPGPGLGHQEVLALLENPEFIQGEISRRMEAANDTTDVRQRTDSLQGELARITTRMRRLLDACQDEVMTLDELKERPRSKPDGVPSSPNRRP